MKHSLKNHLSKYLSTFGLIAGLVLANALQAQVQPLPFYEPFDSSYTNGGTVQTINGVTNVGKNLTVAPATDVWSIGGGDGGGSPVCHVGARMTYPPLGTNIAPDVGLFLTNNPSGNRVRGVPFTATSSGKLYTSFLLNVQAPATNGNRQIAFLTSDSGQSAGGSVIGILLNTSSQLLITKNNSTGSAASSSTNTPAPVNLGANLVVARYTWNASDGDDEVALWLNPSGGSLGVAEGSVPAATVTNTAGTDFASLNHFFIQQRNNASSQGTILLLDEVRIGTTWAQVTPTGVACGAAAIITNPTNQTVAAGLGAQFKTLGTGSTPTYQWQVSTDAGATYNNVSGGVGGNTTTYTTPVTTTADNNNRYRCIINVACGGGSSVTSSFAGLSVTTPVSTPLGVVMDDTWSDFSRSNEPITPTSSVWFGSPGLGDGSSGSLINIPQSNAAMWVGYFTPDTNLPVHLDVGRTIKATLVFTASNVVTNGGSSLRIGLMDYADGGVRLTADGAVGSAGNGAGVRGYMLTQDFGTSYQDDTPMQIYARNNMSSGNLMGATGDFLSLGQGPAGLSNSPAFQSDIEYTFEMSVARTAVNSTVITTKFTGPGLSTTFTTNDTTYAYPRFDTFAFRAATLATTADAFTFTRLKVEVTTNSVVAPPSPIPLAVKQSGTNVILTWTNSAFNLYSANVVTGAYGIVTNATSPYTNPATGAQKFFRLRSP